MEKPLTEHQHQAALIKWARHQEREFPELALLHAIPNGGKRGPKTARAMKAEGVKAGVPDLCLPVARGPYHGLYLELKTGSGRLTKDQTRWLGALAAQGFFASVAVGYHGAVGLIREYLSLGDFKGSGHGGGPGTAEDRISGFPGTRYLFRDPRPELRGVIQK